MKRIIALVMALTLALAFVCTSCASTSKNTVPDVCLDAGHGGEDYGAVYGSRYEKNDTLAMANAVKRELERKGINVVLTRSDDSFVSLKDRGDIANNSGAKLLVSIHRNSGKGANGVEIWINSKNIWADRVLAENIMESLEKTGISKNRGVKTGFRSDHSKNYYINSKTDMPSCLVELGFMGSAEDNKMFDDDIKEYAKSIADAIELTLEDISK